MQLHVSLRDEIDAFDFRQEDFTPLVNAWPQLDIIHHDDADSLRADMARIDLLATWKFESDWYEQCPNLKAIFTPAAGRDWIAPDPAGRVRIHHGTFHGPILAESLLGAILHMNRRMPELMETLARRDWNRTLQSETRLLRGQTVLIIGLGNIGTACAELLVRMGARVMGVKRNVPETMNGVDVLPLKDIESGLARADHAVLLLPGDTSTDRFLDKRRLQQLKKGAFVYNFGRGNSLIAEDLLPMIEDGHIAGAFLDVVEQEPLPPDSPLWNEPRVVITPHSSCVCADYKPRFIEELIPRLSPWIG
ncbi:MAG: D-2-hydroxyacid dehydrogenase [Pseudomonadales bacterium]|nr:D-2-hydroxyacid dehydrogenase [Pseudomonadales bacterium]